MVAFRFCSKILGGGEDIQMVLYHSMIRLQVQWLGYHEVVRTLKPYRMQKNLNFLH